MLTEEAIDLVIEDPALVKKVGFFRSIPLLCALYNPIFTYHAKKWYVKYMMSHGKFSTLFNHQWIYSKRTDDPKLATEHDSISILLVRGIIETSDSKNEELAKIVKRAAQGGFNRVLISIDNIEGLRLDDRRTRTIESMVPTTTFEKEYAIWLERIKASMPVVNCKSKSPILVSYGIYEIARASIVSKRKNESKIHTFEDMMSLDFPLLVMDILLKIRREIRKPYASTHIDLNTIKRFVQPWFDDRREAGRIVIRCFEKISELNDETEETREELGKRIEEKLLSWCHKVQDRIVCQQIQEVIHRCVV